jgi:putative chitinase
MNRNTFLDSVKKSLFKGSFSSGQLSGLTGILDEYDRTKIDSRWVSYMLATAYHETGRAMQPILENLNYSEEGLRAKFPKYFNETMAHLYEHKPEKIANRAYADRMGNGSEKSGDGWKYRGRGFVQLTGKDNYKQYGIELNPDKALTVPVATQVMFNGMIAGVFTGARLSRYFDADTTDWVNARKIINGLDRADDIAGYAKNFYAAIKSA